MREAEGSFLQDDLPVIMNNKEHHPRIIFRTVGSRMIGLGHIVRSIALAQMLNDFFQPVFWLNRPDDFIVDMIKSDFMVETFDFADNDEEIKGLSTELNSSDLLVLDGYQFDGEYQRAIKPMVKKMICIDDLAQTHFCADLVINHGDGTRMKRYSKEPYTKLLTGADYVLLREEFRNAAARQRNEVEKIDTLFICMGGADPFNATNKVLRSALQMDFLSRIIIAIGSAYSFTDEMQKIISTSKSEKEISVRKNIDATEIVDLLYKSQIAVCPASSISLEVASVKCGLMTGMVADNQQAIHDMIITAGCATTAGDFNTISEAELSRKLSEMNDLKFINYLMARQTTFIDGLSGERLLDEFKKLHDAKV
ncbi:MAG: UDP-2,4-diacetamido-2,4,6-trideoxy-beta-L-altropyranose hydrolase [Chitinophagaceae bacterium]|nr:MAG: UDP-2,4-diacetamido-2,4,6-trideoxy-beta-L-altropyranose hydrolase [Chitinophagaceae bacterium]